MSNHDSSPRDFSTDFTVAQAPDAVFAAICNVRGWWSADITGDASRVGDRFVHRVRDLHRCEIAIKQMLPGRKIVWTVLNNHFSFTRDTSEWTGTDIVFEISRAGDQTSLRFTHIGLVPEYECYDTCHDGWTTYIASLHDLVATGTGRPYAGEARTDSERALMDPAHGATPRSRTAPTGRG
ncbi:MAG: SRPBCC domain-containing protein [Luteimonas sp.]|nr:SRPBCC domain-containing protein [Luteimonas sp.]